MTTPSILPTGTLGTSNDFLHAKMDRSGASRIYRGSVSIPGTTADGTIVGMVPFRKGAVLGHVRLYTDRVDSATNVTFDVGYVYDDAVNNTSKTNAFVAASTVPQSGGVISLTTKDSATWSATGDGWLTVKVNNATTTTGALYWNLNLSYDQ